MSGLPLLYQLEVFAGGRDRGVEQEGGVSVNDIFQAAIESRLQKASYQITDLIESYPQDEKVFLLATMQSVVSALKPLLSDLDQRVFDHLVEHTQAIVAPSALDPRRQEADG